ncbi:uncharacterized protein A1O5_13128 [Cladophialophora psammophila CBS 110553]|uniref:Uncharacterized protein n=1 Tax=Cladophialophora psammophila CBS 110553 TaxID=1182543 RepID=W9VNG8_9EURO|nr:uncharacterized protein A1O5_13128 [Cladophialophora psammophila CBS 110553]EXJ53676.1 hypothetical protein A1O5_13128 [Cladophialophora psammophila CBS 110553]
MPTQSARYDALPSLFPGHLPTRAPVSRYSAAAKGGSTNLSVYERLSHHGSDATALDTSFLPSGELDTNDPSPPVEGNTLTNPRSYAPGSMMRDYNKHIIWACLLLLGPLPLSVVLMYLIYANLQPRNQGAGFPDSITVDGTNRSLSDQEYYVNYSATQLVFISSLSSTLALALVPVAMSLFGYMAAFTMQKASNTGKSSNLPSPYQFELAIRLLGGSFTDLYQYLKYIFHPRRKRLAAVPMLHHSALVLALMLSLAVCITMVDALLHIGTSTVQYHSTIPYLAADFNPGRRLPTVCWDNSTLSLYAPCNINLGGSGARTTFSNSTEAYLTLGNQSTRNIVRLADDGKTAVITPPTSPSGVQFTASSYASSTTCETVSKRCKPHYNGDGDCDACQSWAYNCTPDAAGLNISGNFSGILAAGGDFPVVLQFFSTSSKVLNTSNGAAHGQIWSAVLFSLPAGSDEGMYRGEDTQMISDMYYDPDKDLLADTYGNIYGILSCNTTLSDVTYSVRTDGSIYDAVTTPMNDTASSPFYGALSYSFGDPNLGTGVNLAAASAASSEDLAYQFARVFDRTILGLSAGLLPDQQAVSMFQVQTKQVAKVPVAEFVALIVLNLVLPVVGLSLGAWAWVLCVRHGVRDVQARLGIGALVAGLFEDEKFNETATKVEDLYAEMRNYPTARVAVKTREEKASQMFVAVVDDGGGGGGGREI